MFRLNKQVCEVVRQLCKGEVRVAGEGGDVAQQLAEAAALARAAPPGPVIVFLSEGGLVGLKAPGGGDCSTYFFN
jgi:hypothetical protein